jgi:hypothetical protein
VRVHFKAFFGVLLWSIKRARAHKLVAYPPRFSAPSSPLPLRLS